MVSARGNSLGDPASLAGSTSVQLVQQWHVLHTKSQQEKALAGDLSAMGVSYFLPLIRCARTIGRHRALAEVPLFPGYVFLHGTLEEAYLADRTRRVARLIRVVDQTQLEWELTNLRLALEREATLTAYPGLVRGTRVRVRSGPMAGLEGVVEDRVRADRLILQVQTLGRAVSLEIDCALLEPIQ